MERIAGWLGRNLPTSQAATVVHGDYRMGNLMFAPRAPAEFVAILDWRWQHSATHWRTWATPPPPTPRPAARPPRWN
ncbi:phosphotransferase [Streptomyces sp. NPDC001939]